MKQRPPSLILIVHYLKIARSQSLLTLAALTLAHDNPQPFVNLPWQLGPPAIVEPQKSVDLASLLLVASFLHQQIPLTQLDSKHSPVTPPNLPLVQSDGSSQVI